ncbi:hypothetical protein [Neolewinella agarilytica]|uniref:Uncharacterized protein n=1 Tax=Neolewinella agarilytica TaxID=478744 RepID=A0A1H9HBQ6_9BACT|nr:hypothetical protein [Neolewinella agarilytica]SEQ59779.1 hypothetical protein SAMN05444359_11297 [Neolewinella agarilytica]
MYTIPIPLYQHTPLIHFQADQQGATLRATEVKPRLDRFIITRMGWEAAGGKDKLAGYTEKQLYDNGWGYIKKHHPLWISNSDEERQKSLNFRLKIFSRPEDEVAGVHQEKANKFGNYFADVGNEKKPEETVRLVTFHRVIMLKITTPDAELAKCLRHDSPESLLTPFFYANNFGTRQSKGFGSFSPAVKPPEEEVFKFYLNTTDYEKLFRYLELFNRVVRTGVNKITDPDTGTFNRNIEIYMKPLIFSYAASKDRVWEKKLIKETAGYGVYNNQKSRTDTPSHVEPATGKWPAWYQGQGKEDGNRKEGTIRDVMGLSTNQTWMAYDKKSVIKKSTKDGTPQSIDRAPSPFTLVPVKTGAGFTVYVYVQAPSKAYLDHTFKVTFGSAPVGKLNGNPGQLKVFPDFIMKDFIDGFFKKSVVEDSLITPNPRDKEIGQTLQNIFGQIESNRKTQNILPA